MTFSSKLQKLRKDNNLSQEQLASELCVSRQAISKWELGTLPDINNLVKISNFFDCSLDYLMNDNNEDNPSKEYINITQNKIEKENIKVISVKSKLKTLLPGFGIAIAIISIILIKLMSVFFPAPITRQSEDGTWYTDFIGYIDYHNLYGVVTALILLFMLSFTWITFFLFWKKSKSLRKKLLSLIGYVMIIVFCIKSLYEVNTKPFIAINHSELIVSIIYIACATLLLFYGSNRLKLNNRR